MSQPKPKLPDVNDWGSYRAFLECLEECGYYLAHAPDGYTIKKVDTDRLQTKEATRNEPVE